jgi:hypothetical protein
MALASQQGWFLLLLKLCLMLHFRDSPSEAPLCFAMLEVVSGPIRHGIPRFTRLILHDFEAFNRCESVRKHANNPGFA